MHRFFFFVVCLLFPVSRFTPLLFLYFKLAVFFFLCMCAHVCMRSVFFSSIVPFLSFFLFSSFFFPLHVLAFTDFTVTTSFKTF